MTPPGRRTPPAEDGFVLIEVLVSAIVVAITVAGVFSLLNTSARSAAEERHRSEAFSVAQEDQARLRSMRVSELNRLKQTNTVPVDGTLFEVKSTGIFVNDATANDACEDSADYVRLTTIVSWPSRKGRPPATIQSIVSPANGSLDSNHGTLMVTAVNAAGQPIPGIGISGSGAGTFTGTTDAKGCALFTDLAPGNFTLTPSGASVGLVDKDGNPAPPIPASVTAATKSPARFELDRPGSIPVSFQTKTAAGQMVPTTSDSIVVYNGEMKAAKVFGTPGGPQQLSFNATNLFPFKPPSTDAVYAGSCKEDNPDPKNELNPPAAIAYVQVPANSAAPAAVLTLPALYLTVKKTSGPIVGASVAITDTGCGVKRTYTTVTGGTLPNPGMPWGTYTICAAAENRHKTVPSQKLENLTTGKSVTIDLSSGTSSGGC